ncbi:MAG: hypothetical protein IMF10_07545 [Proteobacteria bacterium]|nr:hypothetical protein [Pseudomonadota bacterium]
MGHEAGNGGNRQGDAPKYALCRETTGGQGVHREMESEGFAEKYRLVARPVTVVSFRSFLRRGRVVRKKTACFIMDME